MGDSAGVMFTADGRATPLFIARWRAKGALTPLQARAVLLETDQSASKYLRSVFVAAFPDRRSLPFGPIATDDGRFTDAMLNVWL